ncbi:MAG TPA: glycerate kinase [Mycobacteriales bacterium]|jgi:glycerate kinase|nr:glycerate kinase [Mycobacteriales bacterium]
MRIVLAPDGFGGTLSPVAAAAALAAGWSAAAPGDEIVQVPLSDGGPGFVEVLAAALPDAREVQTEVEDPLARPVQAVLLLDGSTAYVESAAACGLHLLPPQERDPRVTTTYGVGQLLRAALDAGATRVVVGLGGSATDDGGSGLLAAVGLARQDAAGARLAPGGAALAALDRLVGAPDPRLAGVELVAATDVDAPLLGPRGATAVFAPQKGATAAGLLELEAAKTRWADVLEATLGVAVRDLPGAGAAGGMGAALFALGGSRASGVELVSDIARLDAAIEGADLVVTGEGTFDATSLTGKVVSGVAASAARAGVPCLVLAGQVRLGKREVGAAGIAGAYAVADAVGVEAALADPAGQLARLAREVAGQWSRT